MITAEIFQRLEPLSKTDRLLPVGGGNEFKAPLLKDWPNHPGLSIEQLKSWRGLRSVGIAMDDLFEEGVHYRRGFSSNAAITWEIHGVREKLAWRGMIQRKAAEVIRQELQEVGS